MKTLPAIALTFALVAFLFLPVPFEIAGSALFVAGFGAIAVNDYSRRVRSLPLPVGAEVRTAHKERFGLAA